MKAINEQMPDAARLTSGRGDAEIKFWQASQL
jgi:hypothetical protein